MPKGLASDRKEVSRKAKKPKESPNKVLKKLRVVVIDEADKQTRQSDGQTRQSDGQTRQSDRQTRQSDTQSVR